MSNTQTSQRLLYTISGLSALGAAVAIWQTRLFYLTRSGGADLHSFCNIGQTFDCTAIEISKYSELVAGIPLSAVAVAGYLVIFVLAIAAAFTEEYAKNIRNFLVFFTGVAVLFSAIYLGIMVGIIGKLCLLCLGVDVINVVLLICALRLPKPDPAGRTSFKQVAIAGAIAIVISALFARGLNPQGDVKKEDVNDIIESVMNTKETKLDIPSDSPSIGDPNAKVTIVKFSDYECPACRIGATAIHPLFKRYPSGVRFIFVNYPLDQTCNPNVPRKMHEFACEAAEVAICATAQGKFEEAYETLFDHQQDLAADKIADLLKNIPGLDLQKVKECMKLPSTTDKIRRDVSLGEKDKANIQSTPTFFVNGKKVEGGLPTSIWIEIIDRMLKQ